jgi:Smg protein
VKEDILDVLMYLFENYIDDEEMALNNDPELLKDELIEAGFLSSQINKAFNWLEGLGEQTNWLYITPQKTASTRVYLPDECDKLDVNCRGFLLYLEQIGLLDATSRERVIDRVMALDSENLELEQLKWIVLMVLLNEPENENNVAWIEDIVYQDERTGHLH